jgi:hypothetical protein
MVANQDPTEGIRGQRRPNRKPQRMAASASRPVGQTQEQNQRRFHNATTPTANPNAAASVIARVPRTEAIATKGLNPTT